MKAGERFLDRGIWMFQLPLEQGDEVCCTILPALQLHEVVDAGHDVPLVRYTADQEHDQAGGSMGRVESLLNAVVYLLTAETVDAACKFHDLPHCADGVAAEIHEHGCGLGEDSDVGLFAAQLRIVSDLDDISVGAPGTDDPVRLVENATSCQAEREEQEKIERTGDGANMGVVSAVAI